jgi:GT2 family glycosyltransferase
VRRLSVVIPTYRRHVELSRALAALECQTLPPAAFEAIVAADAQEDDLAGLAEVVRARRRPYATRLLRGGRPGASSARNAGWLAAEAPIVLFLDDDVLATPRLLAEHLLWHDREAADEVAVLGHVRWARELRVTPFMRWLEHGTQFDFGSLAGTEASWAHFYTANASVRRVMLERVGGLDEERFPFGYEDLDLGWRLAERGMRLLYNRAAEGEHLHATTLARWRPRLGRIALAERAWIALHPDLEPWFHGLFSAAAAKRRVPAPVGLAAARVPRRLPVLGPSAGRLADTYYRQQLAPAFLVAWDGAAAAQSPAASPGGSLPGGPK